MAYMDGFVIPVPKGNKERYKEVAAYARKHKWTKRPWQPPCHAADYYC